ncbi:MAG TPA: DUF1801 domain-containing protein [Thermoanaerobaculia bacterium]|nr:DUF1801 domain-containing protein [Thermoanaerobaculia bacterium]
MAYEKFRRKEFQGTTAPEVDEYIASAPVFARPILNKIRKAFRFGCPEIEETMKWGAPHFDFHGLVGGMAHFKEHVLMVFRKGQLMSDPAHLFDEKGQSQIATIRFRALEDMPPQTLLTAYVREAAKLNEKGVRPPKRAKKEPAVPDERQG